MLKHFQRFWFSRLRVGLRICISNKLLCDANAVDLGTPLSEPLIEFSPLFSPNWKWERCEHLLNHFLSVSHLQSFHWSREEFYEYDLNLRRWGLKPRGQMTSHSLRMPVHHPEPLGITARRVHQAAVGVGFILRCPLTQNCWTLSHQVWCSAWNVSFHLWKDFLLLKLKTWMVSLQEKASRYWWRVGHRSLLIYRTRLNSVWAGDWCFFFFF